MEFIRRKNGKYQFRCDFQIDGCCGIWAQDGVLTLPFDTKNQDKAGIFTFKNLDEARTWIKGFEAKMKGENFKSMERTDKRFSGVSTKAVNITDEKWTKIKKFMPNSDRFERDQVRAFESYLANNFVDRDMDRFPKAFLNSLSKTIVGKNKLNSHNWGELGNGKFFYSQVKRMSIDETLEFIGGHPDKRFEQHLREIEDRDGGIFWLVPQYYMLNVTDKQQEAIMNIDAGIWGDMSIGFRAPKWVKVMDEKGENIKWWEFQNDGDTTGEALEGSHVSVPAQYGARTTKTKTIEKNGVKFLIKNGLEETDIEIIEDPTDVVDNPIPDVEEVLGTDKGDKDETVTKGVNMKFVSEVLGVNIELPKDFGEEELKALREELEEKHQSVVDGLNDEKSAVDEKLAKAEADLEEKTGELIDTKNRVEELEASQKALEESFGDTELTTDNLKSVATLAESYKKELVDDYINYGIMSGKIEKESEAEERKDAMKLSTDDLKFFVGKFKQIAKVEDEPQIKEIDDDEEVAEKEEFVKESDFIL
jgi:hypothetical protein